MSSRQLDSENVDTEDGPPPHDLDAEQATLGAMLIEAGAVGRALAIVHEEDFWHRVHRLVFRAICSCHARGEPVDIITASAELRRNGLLDEVGGAQYLTGLINEVPTTAHVARYASIVAEKAYLRQVINRAREAERWALSNPPSDDLYSGHQRLTATFHLAGQRLVGPEVANATAITAREAGKYMRAIQWLWPRWIPRGFVTVLAGDPDRGKSAFALALADVATGRGCWPDETPAPQPGLRALWAGTEGRQYVDCQLPPAKAQGHCIVLPGELG